MKKLFTILLALLLVCGCSSTKNEDEVKIGVLQLLHVDALDSAYQGFTDYLDEQGIKYTIDYQNPELDTATLTTMAESLVNGKCDVILAIATSPAQTLRNFNVDTPIVGTAITDYVDANIVNSNEKPGGLITGVSDNCDMDAQFELINKIVPNIKKVGVIYSSGEVNSQIQVKQLNDVCTKNGVELIDKAISNANDIKDTLEYLIRKGVEAIYVPTDNTVAGAMNQVHKVAVEESNIPLINSEAGQVENGGLISLGCDYYKLGKQAAAMAIKILNGADPGEMPIEFQEDYQVYYNSETAKKLGITLPADIIENGLDVAGK